MIFFQKDRLHPWQTKVVLKITEAHLNPDAFSFVGVSFEAQFRRDLKEQILILKNKRFF